ncbi:MAG TPA: flagellar motor protein MotB [Terracidiphilus sp.]|nr:flagellar motor protein MotB [Terracidiphilus sp.]
MATGKIAPIIVIKKKASHGGQHGGAWKVAYADFVTALMALFIVLWLMNSSEKVKKAVAGYFNDPKGTSTLLGTTMSGTGQTVTAATDDMQKLKQKLEEQIKANKELAKLSKQIEITITPEGLRIELIEDKNGTFYESGSAHLSDKGQELLALLATELKKLPNNLLIEGHTDAAQYSNDANYSNWELSADRANSARRLLQADGVRQDQVTQVRGYADQLLRVKNDPYDPSNRRISILVKNQEAPLDLKGAAMANGEPATPPAKPAQLPVQQPVSNTTTTAKAVVPAAGTTLGGRLKSLLPGAKK